MDKSVYIAMTGAAQTLGAQAANNYNLANADTTGFRANLTAFQSAAVTGEGMPSRVNATAQTRGWDFTAGSQITTGRALDVAVQGKGWIAVQTPDGREGYTRAGSLEVNANGLLTTDRGDPVLGNSGPVALPPYTQITIGEDGTVSIVPQGQSANALAVVDRIKLANPPSRQLERGADGLMHLPSGAADAHADASVHLASGVLESSNVNAADALVRMIALARQFDMQVKVMHTADDNAQASSRLLRVG